MTTIKEKINLINDSLDWIKQNRPADYENKFIELVKAKSELRKIDEASQLNPAVAAYGESQKGKSYLMGNLLQKNGIPYKVKANGVEYDFVQRINPIGGGKEATGVVTRFTAYVGKADVVSDAYPARMKVLSVANIITILVDGYLNDIDDLKEYDQDEVSAHMNEIYEKYLGRTDCQSVLVEEDIVDISDYLESFLYSRTGVIRKTGFLNKLALVVRKIPKGDWEKTFSIFWGNEPEISKVFNRLVGTLERLKYSSYVYLPIDAVLHKGSNKNTIMSVECLNGLYKSEGLLTEVFAKSESSFNSMGVFDKSEISALCAEVSFKVDSEFLDDCVSYAFSEEMSSLPGYMTREVRDQLDDTVSKKDLFLHSDLLDFPGARNRLNLKLEFLSKVPENNEQANMVSVILRGKVAFLFNYYSQSRIINILLFCHDGIQPSVNKMYSTIDNWIKTYVGENMEKRMNTIQSAGGISPLFIIGTKFNIDMVEDPNPDVNSEEHLEQRWNGRFTSILYNQCLKAGDVEWFKNWVSPGKNFDNTYVLRDYKYSACTGKGNNLFTGFDETMENPHEDGLALNCEFYSRIRKSFVESEHVAAFFSKRDVAWDVASTVNNDGSLYIIQQLVKVARNLETVREQQFDDKVQEKMNCLRKIMKNYYIDPNVSSQIPARVAKAKGIFREMDFACNNDNYFFGKFIQTLQLEYKEAYEVVHRIVQSPELNRTAASFDQYEIIRKHIGDISDEEQSWKELMVLYGFDNKDEVNDYLKKKNINPKDIIPGIKLNKRSNSFTIAEKLYSYWCNKISSPEFMAEITAGSGFDLTSMDDLIKNTISVAEYFNLCDVMAKIIADEVNVVAVNTINEFRITDQLRNVINKFVTDQGFAYRTEDDIENCKNIACKFKVPVFEKIGKSIKSDYTEEELTNLFIELNESPDVITPVFERNYSLWLEYMLVSFIGGSDAVPRIENEEANNQVADILRLIA